MKNKISNETIELIKEKRQFLSDSESPCIIDICEELQKLREALIWKPVSEGVHNECDVFEIRLGDDICNTYIALQVGECYDISGVINPRIGVYFGRWDIGDILEKWPDAAWREIVEVDWSEKRT